MANVLEQATVPAFERLSAALHDATDFLANPRLLETSRSLVQHPALTRPMIHRDHHFCVPVDHDVRIVRRHDDLAALLAGPNLLHHEVVDQMVVEVVLWLIEHYRLIAMTQEKRQNRSRLLTRRSLLYRYELAGVGATVLDPQAVLRPPAQEAVDLLGRQCLHMIVKPLRSCLDMAARGNRRRVALDGRHPFPYGRYAFIEIRRQAAVQIRQYTAVSIGSQDVLLKMLILASEALPKCWFGRPRIPDRTE